MGKTKLNAWGKKADLARNHVTLPETDTGNLSSKPQTQDDTRINGDGLI